MVSFRVMHLVVLVRIKIRGLGMHDVEYNHVSKCMIAVYFTRKPLPF